VESFKPGPAATDSHQMTSGETSDGVLRSLLSHDPEAVLVALGADGFRVPVPESLDLAGHPTIPVPPDRATMVDLVVAPDRMAVITIWERARAGGLASEVVRLLSDPDRPVTLGIIDARLRHGVWVGVLTREQEQHSGPDDGGLAGSLAIPQRPRTATLQKNSHAIILAVDERTTRMLGWTPEQMVGVRSIEFIHLDDHARNAVEMGCFVGSGERRGRPGVLYGA
jgi:hypothetical protein